MHQCRETDQERYKKIKFVDVCVFGDNILFKEIKKIRGRDDVVSSKMDGNTNPDDIANHLKDMYHGIYNRTGSSQSLEKS